MHEVYVKSFRRGRDMLVAVCDIELLGKSLKGGQVPFEVSERFYKGTASTLEEAIEAMSKATICNLVGKKIVEAAIRNKMVKKSAVIYFEDIPHAQILVL